MHPLTIDAPVGVFLIAVAVVALILGTVASWRDQSGDDQ